MLPAQFRNALAGYVNTRNVSPLIQIALDKEARSATDVQHRAAGELAGQRGEDPLEHAVLAGIKPAVVSVRKNGVPDTSEGELPVKPFIPIIDGIE